MKSYFILISGCPSATLSFNSHPNLKLTITISLCWAQPGTNYSHSPLTSLACFMFKAISNIPPEMKNRDKEKQSILNLEYSKNVVIFFCELLKGEEILDATLHFFKKIVV